MFARDQERRNISISLATKNFVSMVPTTKFLYYPLKIDMLAERIELPSSGYKADVIAIIRKPALVPKTTRYYLRP